jgi:hypothetical protein
VGAATGATCILSDLEARVRKARRDMEMVYTVGIIAIAMVIIGLVWMLRDRITGGRVGLSMSQKGKRAEAEFRAASTSRASVRPPPQPDITPAVDVSGNWMIGANTVRVVRDRVRVARNVLLGKQRINVEEHPPTSPLTPNTKRGGKRNT